MDGSPQASGPFAMNDANLPNLPVPTCLEVIRDQTAHLRGAEGVQVEHPIDGDLDWLILLIVGIRHSTSVPQSTGKAKSEGGIG